MRRLRCVFAFLGLSLLVSSAAFAITIDATALTSPTFRVVYQTAYLSTATVQTVALDAGTYLFNDEANGYFDFTVDGAGLVSYDPAFESFLDGAGTTALNVRGFDITIDARALTSPSFSVSHVTSSYQPTSAVLTLTVLPGTFPFVDEASNEVAFDIDFSGNFRFPAGYNDFFNGVGTPNLVVRGFDITIDARSLSATIFSIPHITGPSYVSTATVQHLTVIPGIAYSFYETLSNFFNFSIDQDGLIHYSAADEGFLDGEGTTALVVPGYTLTVDVRGLVPQTSHYNLVGLINPGSTSVVQSWVGIPGPGYLFACIDLIFFTVDAAGHYQGLPANFLGVGVSGNGTPVFRIGNNAPTVAINSPASGTVVAVGTPVSFVGSFSDDAGDTHTAEWTFDGAAEAGVVNESGATATTSHTFTVAGVYAVTLTVTDAQAASGTASTVDGLDAFVVVYDPSAGFVTGGGWIDSPAGAVVADPGQSGRATFAFSSKYKKGATAPSGETEFRFRAADLSFSSSSYQWLVVAGSRAQYKGTGTVNGVGGHGFMLTAIDGELPGGGGLDRFRIKIWDGSGEIVYDNQLGAADGDALTTTLGGGSVVIRSAGASPAELQPEPAVSGPVSFALHPSMPNPTTSSAKMRLDLPGSANVRLTVYDPAGREVAKLAEGVLAAGRHVFAWDGRSRGGRAVGPGLYLVRVEASVGGRSRLTATQRLTIVR